MAKRIETLSPRHRGRAVLCTADEAFSIQSTTGSSHLCLTFEPMRDPLWLLRRRLCGDRVTRDWLPIFKIYIQILIEGLDCLHSECKLVHTGTPPQSRPLGLKLRLADLKLDNILMTFEDASVLEAFVQAQKSRPMARKIADNGVIYRCHNDFGDIAETSSLKKMYPKIADFGLAQPADRPGPLLHPIQPNQCQAPEVLLGTSWSYPADIWNFGVMVWELLAGDAPFQGGVSGPKPYSPTQHLAEMIAILGPVPDVLVQRERQMRHWRWCPAVHNDQGKLCSNAADFYGGPFFTDDGMSGSAALIFPRLRLTNFQANLCRRI